MMHDEKDEIIYVGKGDQPEESCQSVFSKPAGTGEPRLTRW